MIVTVVVVEIVVIAVVFVVPVSFMHLPALLVVVVVWMAPVGSRIGRPLPNPRDPDIPTAAISPVAINPDEAFSWNRWPYLIVQGWRCGADVDADLTECGNC